MEKLITDPEDADKIPLWADIWPSARGVAHWLWENQKFNREEVLELGAGLGLPGIVCGLLGARVTFSDFNLSALELAGHNAAQNGLADFTVHQGDWRDFRPTKRYPWVLGSDIFYDPQLNRYLKNVICNVTTGDGNLLIAHPGRSATFDFVQAMRAAIPSEERRAMVPVTIDDPYFPYYEIHVHHLKFKS